ncbi:MAG: hypothetical protein IPH38_09070 [Candidatus Microthrix sp.]|nr:hypothetical protein [Candidatus Microthrix sp.]MBK7019725.1 hypothetical protein [Candidatus Microthrix sp.]
MATTIPADLAILPPPRLCRSGASTKWVEGVLDLPESPVAPPGARR